MLERLCDSGEVGVRPSTSMALWTLTMQNDKVQRKLEILTSG